MSRNRKSNIISFSKGTKKTTLGYLINKNGKPILDKTPYRPKFTKIGRYRPTPHNISEI